MCLLADFGISPVGSGTAIFVSEIRPVKLAKASTYDDRDHFAIFLPHLACSSQQRAATRPFDAWSASTKDRPAAAGRSGGSWTRRASDEGSAEAWWVATGGFATCLRRQRIESSDGRDDGKLYCGFAFAILWNTGTDTHQRTSAQRVMSAKSSWASVVPSVAIRWSRKCLAGLRPKRSLPRGGRPRRADRWRSGLGGWEERNAHNRAGLPPALLAIRKDR